MIVSELIPKLKANRYTYYNVAKSDVKNYKNLYKYLKKHQDKNIYTSCLKEFNKWINNNKQVYNNLDYLNKYRAMQILSTNINHLPY